MRGGTMAVAAAIALATATEVAAQREGMLAVRVLAVNQADVPEITLRQAELEATRIFSAVGISLVWTNTRPADPYHEGAAQLKIVIIPDSRIERDRRRIGAAQRLHMAAYAFYSRIADMAAHNSAEVAKMLGHVIAHEIGHLLLPYDSHASRGVMRAAWDRAQFEDMGKGVLTFAPEQADLIRTRVRAMSTN